MTVSRQEIKLNCFQSSEDWIEIWIIGTLQTRLTNVRKKFSPGGKIPLLDKE